MSDLPSPPPPTPGVCPPTPPPNSGSQGFPLPIRFVDLTPRIPLGEAECRKRLTTFATYTIRKMIPDDLENSRPTWAKCEVVQVALAPEEVSKQVRKLEARRSLIDSIQVLQPFQQRQINNLLDELNAGERDIHFEHSLAQMDQKIKSLNAGRRETTSITCYVKRAPRKDTNPVGIYNAMERQKAERMATMSRPPPLPQPRPLQQQGNPQKGNGPISEIAQDSFGDRPVSTYVPEVPRYNASVPPFDPVAAAYQAGRIDADAERLKLDRLPRARRIHEIDGSPELTDPKTDYEPRVRPYPRPPDPTYSDAEDNIERRESGTRFVDERDRGNEPRVSYASPNSFASRQGQGSGESGRDGEAPIVPGFNSLSSSPAYSAGRTPMSNAVSHPVPITPQAVDWGYGGGDGPHTASQWVGTENRSADNCIEKSTSSHNDPGAEISRRISNVELRESAKTIEDKYTEAHTYDDSPVSPNYKREIQPLKDDDDMSDTSDISVSSLLSVADSLFSNLSGTSTAVSSVTGPEVAGERLVQLLLKDDILHDLFVEGINVASEERFERNLRRLLSFFAVDLKKEATDDHERGAANFVRLRARNSAHIICRTLKPAELESKPAREWLGELEVADTLFDSSDSERSDENVDDLYRLEEFIKSSKAFGALRESLRAFVCPRDAIDGPNPPPAVPPVVEAKVMETEIMDEKSQETVANWMPGTRNFRKVQHMLAPWIRTIGTVIWKPKPLKPGKIRVEWRCKCGHNIVDDFTELQPGAAQNLRRTPNHSSETATSKVSAFIRVVRGISSAFRSLCPTLTSTSNVAETSLPLHERSSPATHPGNNQPEPPQIPPPEFLFLLICYSEGHYATKLLQLDLITQRASSDRSLFKLLRENYTNMRRSWISYLSLRTLESIKFVHFEMYKSALVDVRKTDDIPPPGHIDYRYAPAPPQIIPPVGEQHLLHLFQHPECADDESICIDRFPKKLRERLQCTRGVNDGWGLQFVEGWAWKKIWIISSIFFGLGSLLTGVLWAVYGNSIQDAFAISSYIVALGTLGFGTSHALLVM